MLKFLVFKSAAAIYHSFHQLSVLQGCQCTNNLIFISRVKCAAVMKKVNAFLLPLCLIGFQSLMTNV